MARFTKQKSGLYRTNIQLGYGPDGKPIKKSLSARTIKELEQKIFDAKSDILNGLIVNDQTTFGDYANKWLTIYKVQKAVQTQIMYKKAIQRCHEIANIPLRKINRLMIQQIINQYSEHPRTAKIQYITIDQIFESARDDGILSKNPCSGVELPRYVPKERRALTDEEKQKLRSAVLQPQERLLLLLLYGTGCRPAEAYSLTKSDFDFKNATISITKSAQFDQNSFVGIYLPKTNQSIRTVNVSDSICRALQHVIDKIPTENVLGGKSGGIMSRMQYNGLFKKILRKAGLKDSKMILEVYSHLDATKENTREKMASMVM